MEYMTPTSPEITALMIVVHWGDLGPTLTLLKSAARLKASKGLHLLVLSNDPGQETIKELRSFAAEIPNLDVTQSTSNHGYFGGAKVAIEHYCATRAELPDWVIISNNDIVIQDESFLENLFRRDPKEVGVIAPRIQVSPGRVDQNPFMRHRPGWVRWAQLRIVSSHYPLAAIWYWLWRRKATLRSWLAARRKISVPNGDAPREPIYAAHGSFFIFSRRYFEAGGFLDNNLFLYGEEISVAEICRSLNLPIIYEPGLCILHNEHQNTGRRINRFTFECQKNALRYLSSRYMSRRQEAVSLYPTRTSHERTDNDRPWP